MFCRLAKGLGRDVRESNTVVVSLDRDHSVFDDWLSANPDKLGVLERSAEEIEQQLREHLSAELANKGILAAVLRRTDYGPHQRRLHVQVHKWLKKQTVFQGPISLASTVTICYTDEEPDPGFENLRPAASSGLEARPPVASGKTSSAAEVLAAARAEKAVGPEPSQKQIHLNHRFDSWESEEIERTWAKDLIAKFPAAFQAAVAPTWAGIGIVCPNCGHPEVLTEHEVPAVRICVRCGNDAITGEPESVREIARQASEAEREAGVLGMLFSRKAREKQQALKDQWAAAKLEAASQFKRPEAVAENQRRISAQSEAATET
jgi:hypothetical protein